MGAEIKQALQEAEGPGCSACDIVSEEGGLEFGGLGGAGEGDDVADVGHAGDEEHEALEAEAEAAVGHGAEAAGVEIPPHVFHGDVELFDAGHEFVVVFFAL